MPQPPPFDTSEWDQLREQMYRERLDRDATEAEYHESNDERRCPRPEQWAHDVEENESCQS